MIKSSRAAVIEPVVRLLCKPVVIPTTRNNFQSQLSSQHTGERSPSSCMINKQTIRKDCVIWSKAPEQWTVCDNIILFVRYQTNIWIYLSDIYINPTNALLWPVLVFPPLYLILWMASSRASLLPWELSWNSVRASSLNWAMATWGAMETDRQTDRYVR